MVPDRLRMFYLLSAMVVVMAIMIGRGTALSQDAASADDVSTDNSIALRRKVEALIKLMNDDRRAVRVRAQLDLLQMGPCALDHLPPPELMPNASLRHSVDTIRRRLEQQQARDSIQPSTVSLSGEYSLREILDEMTRQTENRFRVSADAKKLLEKKLAVQWRDIRFWKAVHELTSNGKIDVSSPAVVESEQETEPKFLKSGVENTLLVTQASENETASHAIDNTGVFRVELTKVQLRPALIPGAERLLRVTVRLTAEPRLQPLFMRYTGKDASVSLVGHGHLESFSPNANKEIPLGNSGNEVEATWNFPVPDGVTVQFISLDGDLTVQTAAGQEEFVFRNLTNAKGKEIRRGGLTVRLDDIQFQPASERIPPTSRLFLSPVVSYDRGGPAFESHRTWIFHNDARVVDDAGKPTRALADFKTLLQTDGNVKLQYTFDRLSRPMDRYSFRYVAPTLIINIPVKFQFDKVSVTGAASGPE